MFREPGHGVAQLVASAFSSMTTLLTSALPNQVNDARPLNGARIQY